MSPDLSDIKRSFINSYVCRGLTLSCSRRALRLRWMNATSSLTDFVAMEDYSAYNSAATWIVTISIVLATVRLVSLSRSKPRRESDIPRAPGAVPILGHALAYKRDPARFLLRAREQAGDVFELNLAGKRMVVVCGPSAQRKVASAPESIMSARRAVADVGFEEMLGHLNVYRGTDLHKGIIKGWTRSDEARVVGEYISAARSALRVETLRSGGQQQRVEFMSFVRRVILRAVIDIFIGPFFLRGWEFNLIEQFMAFQDDLEDCTAKSAVLPRKLALPLFLLPLKRRRLRLEQIIAKRLNDALEITVPKDEVGFWLVAVKESHSVEEVAELIVGLLFAGTYMLVFAFHFSLFLTEA